MTEKEQATKLIQEFQCRLVWLAGLTGAIVAGHTVERAADAADSAVKAFGKRYGPIELPD